jgi:hypothetical protein
MRKIRCAAFVSMDAGATWMGHDFSTEECFDPWVAITADGRALFAAFGRESRLLHQGRSGLVAFHSPDGGRTWGEPTGLGRNVDHPTIVVDGSSPPRAGWLYVVSSLGMPAENALVRSMVSVVRSRNGGRTFDLPTYVRPNNLTRNGQTAAVLSDGSLVISFVETNRSDGRPLGRHMAWVARSTDGGARFSDPMFVSDACGSRDHGFGQSWLVADTSHGPFRDRLYYVCNQPASRELLAAHSSDEGESWTDARRVHSSRDTIAPREIRAAAVNRRGVLGVVWSREARESGAPCISVYFSASLDGGSSFLPEVRVNSVPACEIIDNKLTRSDYYGMVTDDSGHFRVLWSDPRAGLFQLRTAVIEVDGVVTRPSQD